MIYNKTIHKQKIEEIRDLVFDKNFNLQTHGKSPFVNIKSDADTFFVNLNKYHVFKEKPFERSDFFYKNVIFNELLNEVDLKYNFKYLINDVMNLQGVIQKENTPAIFCSFHYGPYLHVATALRMLDKKFAVVSNVIKGNDIIHWDKTKEQIEGNIDYFTDFEVINPLELDAIFQIYNCINNGKSILIFIDGLQGGVSEKNKRNKKVSLLESKLFLSSGITEISKKLEIPIIPVISKRLENIKIEISFYDAVCQKNFSNKDYVVNALQECVDVFSPHLKECPEQWQEWPFVHNKLITISSELKEKLTGIKFIKSLFRSFKNIPKPDPVIKFNELEYQIFCRDNQYFLINIENYYCFKISNYLMKILEKVRKSDFKENEIKSLTNPTLFSDLLQKKVLKKNI